MAGAKNLFTLIFYKIAEPRVVRLLYFAIYTSFLVAGLDTVINPPYKFDDVIGKALVYLLGSFAALGSILCFIAVLPGIWWLERAGIIALMTAVGMYIVLLINLEATSFSIAISLGYFVRFILRWLEIRPYELAPRKE